MMKSQALWVVIATGAVFMVAPKGATHANALIAVNASAVPQQEADGRKLYLKNCRQCHSATGEPSKENKTKYPKIKSLNDATFLVSLSDDSILTVMKKGAGKDMKSFRDKLSDAEMVAVLKYVRTLPKEK
jgi:mono/diheme cytochrome c family protein